MISDNPSTRDLPILCIYQYISMYIKYPTTIETPQGNFREKSKMPAIKGRERKVPVRPSVRAIIAMATQGRAVSTLCGYWFVRGACM